MKNYIVIYHCAFEDVDWTVITIDGKNLQGDALNELIDQKLRTLIEEGEGSIFDCRNEPSLCYGNESRWICGNCYTTYTEEELLTTFEEED